MFPEVTIEIFLYKTTNKMPQISKIHFVIKLYMFRVSFVHIIRSYLLYTRQLVRFMQVMWPFPSRVRLELRRLCDRFQAESGWNSAGYVTASKQSQVGTPQVMWPLPNRVRLELRRLCDRFQAESGWNSAGYVTASKQSQVGTPFQPDSAWKRSHNLMKRTNCRAYSR